MCCGFGVKVPRGWGKICATRWSPIFFLTIHGCSHARFPPKPGHISPPPHRSGSLVCFCGIAENRGCALSWLRGFTIFFIPAQNKPKFPQTESECGFQDVFVKFLFRSDRCIPQVLRSTFVRRRNSPLPASISKVKSPHLSSKITHNQPKRSQ
jgi:hypothetical protein